MNDLWRGEEATRHKFAYRSFTEEQGSIISSFAATLATAPSVTLFKYTIGVLPTTPTPNHFYKPRALQGAIRNYKDQTTMIPLLQILSHKSIKNVWDAEHWTDYTSKNELHKLGCTYHLQFLQQS